jgi:hypothetical protein
MDAKTSLAHSFSLEDVCSNHDSLGNPIDRALHGSRIQPVSRELLSSLMFRSVHRLADDAMRIGSPKLVDHRSSLLKNTVSVLDIVAGKLVGVNSDGLGHIARHEYKVGIAGEHSISRCAFQNRCDIDENFFPLFDAHFGHRFFAAIYHGHSLHQPLAELDARLSEVLQCWTLAPWGLADMHTVGAEQTRS